MLTTAAAGPMIDIHNTKRRMPVILPPELAFEWLQNDLTEERIQAIATHQYDASRLKAWPVAKNFLSAADPAKEVHYENLPPL